MRAKEFVAETAPAGTTSAGSVATVPSAIGAVISRTAVTKPAKYRNSLTQGNPQKNVSR